MRQDRVTLCHITTSSFSLRLLFLLSFSINKPKGVRAPSPQIAAATSKMPLRTP